MPAPPAELIAQIEAHLRPLEVELATYEVRTTTELEDLELKQGRVYTLRPDGTR